MCGKLTKNEKNESVSMTDTFYMWTMQKRCMQRSVQYNNHSVSAYSKSPQLCTDRGSWQLNMDIELMLGNFNAVYVHHQVESTS